MKRRVTIKVGGWEYVLEQDSTDGDIQVVSRQRITLAQKAVEYVKAEASALVGSVPLSVVETRKAACFGCESLEVDGENWYCKSCGCPKWERSRLQVKWELPGAACPLSKWPVGE